MTITEAVRATVLQALRTKSLTKQQMATALDVTPSWVTKFFNKELRSIDDDKAEKLEAFTGLKFKRLIPSKQLPGAAVHVGEEMLTNPAVAGIMNGLAELLESKVIYALPHLETEDLRTLGQGATRIVMKWEEAKDPHYGRIGRELVELITQISQERQQKAASKQ